MLRNYLWLIVIVVSVAVRASSQNSGSGAKNVTLQTAANKIAFVSFR